MKRKVHCPHCNALHDVWVPTKPALSLKCGHCKRYFEVLPRK